MKLRDLALLVALQALVVGAVMFFQHSPGYMDADYYTLMGERLAQGDASEPFLWNYLDNPSGVPHPAFAYWQPLPAVVAAWGYRALPHGGFAAARLFFLLLALLVPPLTALLAWHLTHRRDLAWMSGALAVFSGFYLRYLAVPETFTPLLVLGALFFLLVGWPERWRLDDWLHPLRLGSKAMARGLGGWLPLALGVVAGALHLARTEGVLWLLAAWGGLWLAGRRRLTPYAQVLLGYAVLMLPWMGRNLAAFGAPFAPGGWRALWLTNYNDLFAYPADRLTFAHWWASGLKNIFGARLHAAGTNLLSAVAVEGEVIWLPFAVVGGWRLRRERRVVIGAAMWLALWGVMSAVFPFAGERGGFFHAATPLQPLIWALAPLGLAVAVRRLASWRGWHASQAFRVLGWGLVAVTAALTFAVTYREVVGGDFTAPVWDKEARAYARFDAGLAGLGVPSDALILVNNPPGFTWVTHRPTLAIPEGGAAEAAAVARRYGARYMLLEANQPRPLRHAYCHPTTIPAPWRFLGMADRYTPVFVLEDKP